MEVCRLLPCRCTSRIGIRWRTGVGRWANVDWHLKDPDDVCGICQNYFDGVCGACRDPGDGCPLGASLD